MTTVTVRLRINETNHACDTDPGETLLELLRDRLGLTATKIACGRGECGACTVLVGGRPVPACVTLACFVDEEVETCEGLAREALSFREALADHGGFQCSYCTPGFVVRAVSLLRQGLPASDGDLRLQLSGNLCRCTGYQGIVEALRMADARRERRP